MDLIALWPRIMAFTLRLFRWVGVALGLILLLAHPAAKAGIDTGLAGDDVAAGPFPIGFTFRYYGQNFTQFNVSTNGLIQFSAKSTAYSNGCLPSQNNTLYVFWDDLRTNVSGQPNGKIQYQTLGEAPDRKLVVQWTNQYFYGTNLPMGTFQAVLSEGTNEIKYQYRYLRDPRSTGNSATIGIQGATSTQIVQHGCNQTSISAEQAISFTPDASGLVYQINAAAPYDFLDISGLTPAPPAVSANFVKASPTWTWVKIPELNTYQIELQTDTGEVVHSEVVGNVGSYVWTTGYEAGKSYRARVRGSVNSGATWEIWSGLSQTITVDQTAPSGQMTAATQTDGAASIDWRYSATDDLSGVYQIRLQLAHDAEFQNIVFDDYVPLTGTYRYTAATPEQRVYGRIQVTDKAGNTSSYSNVVDILILPPPTAGFVPSVTSGEAPLDVTFQNTTTGSVTSYLWDFGDGRTSSVAQPTIRYSEPGTFNVSLQATGIGGTTETTHSVTVTPDVTSPAIGTLTVDGVPLSSNLVLEQASTLVIAVFDASGATVTANLSGQPIVVTDLGGGNFRLGLDALQFANGTYVLQIAAQDASGNMAEAQLDLVIDLPPPPAPVLTAPVAGWRTNQTDVLVHGTTALGLEAQITVNGVSGEWLPVMNQHFETTVSLTEGLNQIGAVVRSLHGTSAATEIPVTLDTSRPVAPTGLSANSQLLGKIRLTWTPSTDAASRGTIVFRSTSAFEDVAQATRLTANPLTGSAYDDIPAADGTYFYRVASINDLGTLSLLSNSVQGAADTTPPRAVSVVYAPQGKTDPTTGRIGQGLVGVTVTVNEALQSTPYLSIVPEGSTLIPVTLTKTDETTYTGSFLITANTGSGTANALFSARDLVGNRGTAIESGSTLLIDTAGPVLSGIALAPEAPIKSDATPTVEATFTLSKPAAAVPTVSYLLSGSGRERVALTGLGAVDGTTWRGSFTLPADAGALGAETLSFGFEAKDDLDNVSTKVTAPNAYQVYQGELPALATPWAFTAKAQPGGKVALTWEAVPEASSYQLYRQGPGESELTARVRSTGTSYTDATEQDGMYSYAVASVRASNGQEALSAPSAPVQVLASATAPGAPENFALQLTGQGIVASWQAPLASAVASYNLYRAAGASITSTEGLTPLKTGIKQLLALDTSPSPTQAAYAVTALDAAGNESPVSNSGYLNASLLPVRNLQVAQTTGNLPTLSWDAPNGSVAGYLVYVGAEGEEVKLTPAPITSRSFTDTGYTAGERRYTVASVDANGVEMPRSILLPSLTTQVASGLPILRGLMNRLQVQVTNTSALTLSNARVIVRLPADASASQYLSHTSEPFSLGADETRLVPVVVGGYAELPSSAPAQIAVEIAANEGELVKLTRTENLAVGDGAPLVVGMATEDFTRGATGKVRLTIENTSEVEVELLTATANGMSPSNELRFKLLDGDGNILATQAYRQALGANVVTLTNGLTVARIPAGASFVSDTFELGVPGSSPTNLRVKLEVDKLRYHTGRSDQVIIPGRGSEKTVSLIDTAYVGEVTEVTPLSSFGDQNVRISGRALDRATNAPLPNTRLKLVLNQEGFERTYSVLTDGTGNFVYSFVPTLSDAGLYKVSVVHPDVTDRPEQKAFTINRVTLGPTPYKLNVPKNYPFSIPFTAKAGAGTRVSNLRFVLEAASQPTGEIPAGIKLTLPAPVSLSERQTLNIPVSFTANNEAQLSGALVLNVLCDEQTAPIGRVRVDYALSEAKPYLTSTPSYVQSGILRGSSEIESVTIENKGLQEALNLQFTLSNTDGTAAPAWVTLMNQANGTLPVGGKRVVDLSFAPPEDIEAGVYEFKLNVRGDNVPTQALNVYAVVSVPPVPGETGQVVYDGKVFFKVADIYTGTFDKNGNLIEGLANANIILQNEDNLTYTYQLVTDSLGEAVFQNLPYGYYKFRAKATNHQETGGRLQVKPGITVNQPVFLNYNVVTVEWSVREITIEDRYEITLNATFETDVPAPVVVMQPTGINLPKMAAGDVFFGELTLSNYGLVRAENVTQQLPRSDAFFRFEFLTDVPPTLEAKQSITLPYRVVALQSLDPTATSGTASGGGCYSYSNSMNVDYSFPCANGSVSTGSASSSWFSSDTSTCSIGGTSGGTTGGTGGWSGGWSGGFGGGTATFGTTSTSTSTSTPIRLKGTKCVFIPTGGGPECE